MSDGRHSREAGRIVRMLQNHLTHMLALLIVAVWGTTFVSTKVLIREGLSPAGIFFVRFAVAYLCILPFSCRRLWADSLRDEALLLAAGITGGSLYFLTENMALQYSYCSNVSLLVCSTPMLTTLLLGLFYREERVNLRQFLFSLTALAGMALVVLNGHFVLKLSPQGDLLALAAALTWALYSLCLRMLGRRYPMLFVTRKIFFYGVLTILPVFFFQPLPVSLEVCMRPAVWGNLLFLAVVASFLCYFGWNIVMSRLGVVRSTNYIYLNPAVTLVTSHLILDERITPLALIGAVMIVGGICLAERSRKR